MTMNQLITSIAWDEERARAGGHGPLLQSCKLKAANGIYPVGLLIAENSDGDAVPHAEAADVVIGTGTGDTKAYAATLANAPLEPGSVEIADGVETFSDDGLGRLAGDAGGTGTVVYSTGAVAVSFAVNVLNESDVLATSWNKLKGVLDERVDTASSGSGLYIPHGTVRRDVLKIGITTPAAPNAAKLKQLIAMGIYPV